MAEQQDKPRRQRKIGCLTISVVLALVLFGAYTAYRLILQARVRAELEAIRRAGYPVTLEELDSWYEYPPPGEPNAADVYLEAFLRLVAPSEEQSKLLPLVGTAESPLRAESLSDEMKKAIAKHLAANKEALELLHKAASIEHCRYPVDLTVGLGALSPLRGMRGAARLLVLQAILQAENGEADRASRSLSSLMSMARSLDRNPGLISQLMRITCRYWWTYTLEHVLSRISLNDPQLQNTAIALRNEEQADCMLRAMVGVRCAESALYASPYEDIRSGAGFPLPEPLWLVYMAAGLREMDHLTYLDFAGEIVRVCEMPVNQRAQALRKRQRRYEHWERSTPDLYCLLTKILAPSVDRSVEIDVLSIGRLRAARTGLAVERYRLDERKLPEALGELVPGYMEAIPEDPFDGKPLRYKKLQKSYIVYSIGPDGVDDGGLEKDPAARHAEAPDVTFTVER